MSEPIRVGLVGLGRAGNGMHKKELGSRQDKFRFYAVCDIIEERTVPFVEEFGSKPYTRYEDMLAAGIIDPTKVSRSALQNACSIASVLLTTESLVCDIPVKEAAAPAQPPMY